MKNKISKYLSSKDKASYTDLDLLFEMYLDGRLENELVQLKIREIEIFADFNRRLENSIQINFKYYNLACIIDFSNKGYEYVIYAIGDSFDQIKNLFIDHKYGDKFSYTNLIKLVYQQLSRHEKLKDNAQLLIKKKKYKTIANICLIIPCVIIGVISIYVLISKETITLDPLFTLIIVAPIILWFIFHVKSAKIR